MSVLELHNGTLTLVRAAGFAPDYDRDAAPGVTKFTGAERVYWSETEARITTGTGSDVIVSRSLLVDPALPVTWVRGDIVTVTRDGASVAQTGIVRSLMTSGTDETDRVTRLLLEDA